MSDEKRGEEAFSIHKEIITNEEARRKLLAKNASLLAQMFETGLYKDILGDKEAEWAGYLGEVDIFYSRNQVNSFIKVYKKLTKELGVGPDVWVEVPITRLVDIMPIIDANNWQDWLFKGVTLITRDWNIEVRKAKGLLSEEEHEEHDDTVYKICKQCGSKRVVHDHK